jgi:glycosyltransferase involved in cell wall biosynthesis
MEETDNFSPLVVNLHTKFKEKIKISFFLSHPIQYISPLLKELANTFELHVYYFSDASIKGTVDKGFGQKIKWDIPLLEGYQYTIIKNYSFSSSLSNQFFDLINPGILTHLFKDNSKIIIVNGWSYFSDILTIMTAKMLRKKVWIRAENPLSQEKKASKFKIFLKKILLKRLLFHFFVDRFLYIGAENKSFFKYYGVEEKDMIYTPYAVDNSFFNLQYQTFKNRTAQLKNSFGIIPGKKIVLFSGKYIPKKRPLDLLEAFHFLNDSSAFLIMLGDGELRHEMELYIENNKMNNVMLTGFINQASISKYYAIADVFVMCSGIGETWGLSVNEAMNFQKPVIVSKTCGSCADLVKDGENGFSFEEGNIQQLAGFLRRVLNDPDFRLSAGQKSAEIVTKFSINHIVSNMMAAVN